MFLSGYYKPAQVRPMIRYFNTSNPDSNKKGSAAQDFREFEGTYFNEFPEISTFIDVILDFSDSKQSQIQNMSGNYKWTGFVCCERYIFKYLELKEKEKRGEGRKKKVNK